MNSDLQKLIDLQQVDSRIAVVKAEVAALPKQVQLIEAKLAGSKAQVETAQAAIKADDSSRRKYESEIQDQQQRISKYRDQSLGVKTNPEYKALLHEIEFAEAAIRKLEDKILEIMVAADTRKDALKHAEAALKADTAANEKEKEHARQQTAEDEQLLAELTAQRKDLRAGIAEDTLQHYDRLLKHRGSALAAVQENQMCGGCSVMLRPQPFQVLINGEELVTCDSCQRILYYIAPPPKLEDEAGKKATAVPEAPPQQEAVES
ncbi:MAG: C4-type zinc ribbon domain-containing protein [Acidobacteriota bacterium]|nr:C4-type zinc ribbon domain-containing protein [Acidobacteriota bacterium]